jgi:hypothetical protein
MSVGNKGWGTPPNHLLFYRTVRGPSSRGAGAVRRGQSCSCRLAFGGVTTSVVRGLRDSWVRRVRSFQAISVFERDLRSRLSGRPGAAKHRVSALRASIRRAIPAGRRRGPGDHREMLIASGAWCAEFTVRRRLDQAGFEGPAVRCASGVSVWPPVESTGRQARVGVADDARHGRIPGKRGEPT